MHWERLVIQLLPAYLGVLPGARPVAASQNCLDGHCRAPSKLLSWKRVLPLIKNNTVRYNFYFASYSYLLERQNKYQAPLRKFSTGRSHFRTQQTTGLNQLCLFLQTGAILFSTPVTHYQIPLQNGIFFSETNMLPIRYITSSSQICHFPVSFLLPRDVGTRLDSTCPPLDNFPVHLSHVHILGRRKLNRHVASRQLLLIRLPNPVWINLPDFLSEENIISHGIILP